MVYRYFSLILQRPVQSHWVSTNNTMPPKAWNPFGQTDDEGEDEERVEFPCSRQSSVKQSDSLLQPSLALGCYVVVLF